MGQCYLQSVIREAAYGRMSLRTPEGREGGEAFGSVGEESAGRGDCKGKVPRVKYVKVLGAPGLQRPKR